VLHRVAQDLLFIQDSHVLEDLDVDDFEEWRKRRPARRLHNLVVWIHRSNKATATLRGLQENDPDKAYPGTLDVVLDNSTRWLSQYYMIERAVKLRRYLKELAEVTFQKTMSHTRPGWRRAGPHGSLP
jgi:hypothetical protein